MHFLFTVRRSSGKVFQKREKDLHKQRWPLSSPKSLALLSINSNGSLSLLIRTITIIQCFVLEGNDSVDAHAL
jgi:hypothetical protein